MQPWDGTDGGHLKPGEPNSTASDATRSQPAWAVAIGAVIGFCVLVGFYFGFLQNLYYSHYQPFFDSLGYYDRLHAVILKGRSDGVLAAVELAIGTGTTVVLPYLVAAICSPFVEPGRNFGVWLQTAELGMLLISLLYFFYYVKKVNPLPGLLLLVPFALTTCLFRNNGGMSDFRMDLSLYFTYALACVWYLTAVATGRWLHFFFVGLAIASACLFRATAPVYLVLGLGPLAALELVKSNDRRALIIGLGISLIVAIAGSLWFYVIRFDHLHYYYFVWNTDANAKLPIAESLAHVQFATKHIGSQFLFWLVGISLVSLLVNWSAKGGKLLTCAQGLIVQAIWLTDWRLVWLAAAPIAMLVLRGAGLNPFVCMPAVIGVLLWILNPLANDRYMLSSRWGMGAAAVISLMCLGSIAIEGWQNHRPGEFNSMIAHQQAVKSIVEDAKHQQLQQINYDSTHVYYLNSSSIGSLLKFDVPGAEVGTGSVKVDGVNFVPNRLYSRVVAQANWDRLEGEGLEKVHRLIDLADDHIDYLIVPDEVTIEFLESKIHFNIINQHQRLIRRHVLESGNWVAVESPIVNGEHETVQVFRNQKRTMIAQSEAAGSSGGGQWR